MKGGGVPITKKKPHPIFSKHYTPYPSVSFIQHNIGQITYFMEKEMKYIETAASKKKLYENTVQNKTFLNRTRSLRSYMKYFGREFNADILTLQEVQEKDGRPTFLTLPRTNMSSVYQQTGHFVYANANETRTKKIHHGCAVVFNRKRFVLVQIIPHKTLHEDLAKRASPWVILRDTYSPNNVYAVCSLHNFIPSNIFRAKRFVKVIHHMVNEMKDMQSKNYKCLVGTDLNINLFYPNIHPKFSLTTQKVFTELSSFQFVDKMKENVKALQKYVQVVNNGKKKTNYNYHREKQGVYNATSDSLDYIFYDKAIHSQSETFYPQVVYNVARGTKGTKGTNNNPPTIGKLKYLENDYDHMPIHMHFTS